MAIDVTEKLQHSEEYPFWVAILLSIGFIVVMVILVVYGYLVFKKWQIALLESGDKQRKLITLVRKLLEKARLDKEVSKDWIKDKIEDEWKKIEGISWKD